MLGFGQGGFRKTGRVHNAVFMLPPNEDKRIAHFFGYDSIEFELSFGWFKQNIVCDEQPWICRRYPEDEDDDD